MEVRYARALSRLVSASSHSNDEAGCPSSAGMWGLQFKREDFYYFFMDWWFAARPEVARSWIAISERWDVYRNTLRRMRVARWFSHYIWAIHVHDQLNLTAEVRFKAGARVNLVRSAYPRLRMGAGQSSWLGEYKTDAVGGCGTLNTSDGTARVISSDALLRTPVDPRGQLGLRFDKRFAPMAEQCALARLGDPVICCGEPRQCGVHICGSSWAVSNARFFASGQAAVLLSRATARARAH